MWTLCVMTVCGGIASSVRAQDVPRIEIGGGYQNAAIRHEFEWANYQGWSIEEATFVRPRLALPVVVDAAFWNWVDPRNSSGGERHSIYGFLAGLRVTASQDRTAVPFVQMLAGRGQSKVVLSSPGSPSLQLADSAFVIQPGGGVDVRLTRQVWIRSSVAARVAEPLHTFSWQYAEWRFGAGLVFGFTR
jgi:hypothetical protein